MPGLTHPYASPAHARALAGAGRAVDVPAWRGFVLARPIAAGGEDALGAYPLAVLAPDADIPAGLDTLRAAGLVSLVMVPDPLAGPPAAAFAGLDLCRPFKTHYLVRPGDFSPSKHHRERIRRGRRRCRVERVALADHLETWRGLYAGLVDRRAIGGVADFSDRYFADLAAAPWLQAFAAHVEDRLVAMTLWFEHAGVVYNHLTASDAEGYRQGANYALYAAAIEHFAGASVANLGGGAGFADDPADGLAAFKRGFSDGEVKANLVGAILDRGRYAALSAGRETAFFPAYRG